MSSGSPPVSVLSRRVFIGDSNLIRGSDVSVVGSTTRQGELAARRQFGGRDCPMSEDAWKNWYRDEKPSPAGAGPAPDATHDMAVAASPPGGAGAGDGAGAPGVAGPPGTRGRWPEQPPVRSGYQAEP